MLNFNLEFRKGILFIRLHGVLNKDNYFKLNNLLKDFKYVVINIDKLIFIDTEGINELIKLSDKVMGELFICSSSECNYLEPIRRIQNELEAFNLI